jgi:hypothetical protein
MNKDTPLLWSEQKVRTYIGTVLLKQTGWWATRLSIREHDDLQKFMADHEWNWINTNVPDWLFWKDEFRLQAHLYVNRHLSDNMLMLASLIFVQTEPSHYPLGDEAVWIRKDAH